MAVAPAHVDALIGVASTYIALGEASQKADRSSDAESYFQRALDSLSAVVTTKTSQAASGSRLSPRLSRLISPVEGAAAEYSRAYVRVRLYETQPLGRRDERLLKLAADAFANIPRNDANYYKAQRALSRVKARVRGSAAKAVRLGEAAIAVGAFLLFVAANIAFWWGKPTVTRTTHLTGLSMQALRASKLPAELTTKINPLVGSEPVSIKKYTDALRAILGDSAMSRYGETIMNSSIPGPAIVSREPIDAGPYALLAFGSLVFMVIGLYLQQLSKLSFGGISLEKTSEIAPRETASFGVSAPASVQRA